MNEIFISPMICKMLNFLFFIVKKYPAYAGYDLYFETT